MIMRIGILVNRKVFLFKRKYQAKIGRKTSYYTSVNVIMLKLVFLLYVVEMCYLRETPTAWVFCWCSIRCSLYGVQKHNIGGMNSS